MGIVHSKNYSIRKKLFKRIFIPKIWKLFIQKDYSFFWKIDYRPGLWESPWMSNVSLLANKSHMLSDFGSCLLFLTCIPTNIDDFFSQCYYCDRSSHNIVLIGYLCPTGGSRGLLHVCSCLHLVPHILHIAKISTERWKWHHT